MQDPVNGIVGCPVSGQEAGRRVVLCFSRDESGVETWLVEAFDNKSGQRFTRECPDEQQARTEFNRQLERFGHQDRVLGPGDEDPIAW